MEKANSQNACSQKIYAKLLNNLLTNSRCKKGIYGSDQCENIGFLAQAGNNLKELAFTNLKISYPLAFSRKSTCDFSSKNMIFKSENQHVHTRRQQESMQGGLLTSDLTKSILLDDQWPKKCKTTNFLFKALFSNQIPKHYVNSCFRQKKSENTLKNFGSDEV